MTEIGEDQPGSKRNEIYGVLWPQTVNQEALDAWRDYDLRDDDVIVVSYPKSGRRTIFLIISYCFLILPLGTGLCRGIL